MSYANIITIKLPMQEQTIQARVDDVGKAVVYAIQQGRLDWDADAVDAINAAVQTAMQFEREQCALWLEGQAKELQATQLHKAELFRALAQLMRHRDAVIEPRITPQATGPLTPSAEPVA